MVWFCGYDVHMQHGQSDRLMPRIKKEDGDYVYTRGLYSAPRLVDQQELNIEL